MGGGARHGGSHKAMPKDVRETKKAHDEAHGRHGAK